MKIALISPEESVQYVSGWKNNKQVFSVLPNSQRVAEVLEAEQNFLVAPPMYWRPCADEVVADQWYFDSQSNEFLAVPPVPPLLEVAPLQEL